VAFPPPTVTFPSTRLEVPKQFKRLLLPFGGSLPKVVVCFYPNNLKKFFNFSSASLSASIQGVMSADFRL
jgi:hypothetical protein